MMRTDHDKAAALWAIEPVSYTHLDVYKRQLQICCALCRSLQATRHTKKALATLGGRALPTTGLTQRSALTTGSDTVRQVVGPGRRTSSNRWPAQVRGRPSSAGYVSSLSTCLLYTSRCV